MGKTLVMCYVAFVLKSKNKKSTEGNNHSEGKNKGEVEQGRDRLAEGPHLDTVSLGDGLTVLNCRSDSGNGGGG